MERFILICLFGALGTGTRHLVNVWAAERWGVAFPFGTLFVNLAGCFLIGFLAQWALSSASFSPTLRLALTTGFLGGLTTYSSFNYETTRLAQGGAFGLAAVNLGATLVGCAVAGILGMGLAGLLTER
jgi:CrcB protein